MREMMMLGRGGGIGRVHIEDRKTEDLWSKSGYELGDNRDADRDGVFSLTPAPTKTSGLASCDYRSLQGSTSPLELIEI